MPRYSNVILKMHLDRKYKDCMDTFKANYKSDEDRNKAIENSQEEFVSDLMSYLTDTIPSKDFRCDEEMYDFVLHNVKIDGKTYNSSLRYKEKHKDYVNELFGETYTLVGALLSQDESKVEIPDIDVEKKINTLLYEGLENNKFSLSHSEEVNYEFGELSGLFKSHLLYPDRKEIMNEIYESLDRVQEACDKYDFINSKDLKNSFSDEYKKNIKEIQKAKELSSSVDLIKSSINTKNKNFDLTVKQTMRGFGPNGRNLEEVMKEKNPEQFLLKLTNTKTPEEGLIRLNSLYIDAEVNGNRKDFSKTVGRDLGYDGMIEDKRSLLSELKIRDFDIFDKRKVRGATEAFYKLCKNKLDPSMSVYSLESKVVKENDGDLIEQVSFKKFLDSKDLKDYYQKNPPEESKNTTEKLRNLDEAHIVKNKGSQSDEYKNFKQAFDDLKAGKNTYPNEKLAQSINKLMSFTETYIMEKRKQKGMTSTDILDKETNDKMVGKIFWGYGKDRYDFAVKVYEEMSKMKKDLEKNWTPDTHFLYSKESMSNEVRGKGNDKVTSRSKNLNLEKNKDLGFE